MIRVELPFHLRNLAKTDKEVTVEVDVPVTPHAILDALEASYPVLRGTVRDTTTLERRALLRFFGCGQDLSHEPMDAPLPEPIARGDEPFCIVGAMAGG